MGSKKKERDDFIKRETGMSPEQWKKHVEDQCLTKVHDACPHCKREFYWDACTDEYRGANMYVAQSPSCPSKDIQLWMCPDDGAVIAVQVTDDFGSDVYVPSKQAL